MKTPCGKELEGCPYKERGKCYEDTDHKIPRYLGRQASASALLKNYIRSDANKQQLCRYEHDQKSLEDLRNPPEIPDEKFMIDAIIKSRRAKRGREG